MFHIRPKPIEIRRVGAVKSAKIDYIIPEIVLSGNTYPIKAEIEGLGFGWSPEDGTWRLNTTDRERIRSVVVKVMDAGDCRLLSGWLEGVCSPD